MLGAVVEMVSTEVIGFGPGAGAAGLKLQLVRLGRFEQESVTAEVGNVAKFILRLKVAEAPRETVALAGATFMATELMEKLAVLEVAPPKPVFVTLTRTVPGDATSLAEMDAVSCEVFTNVVARGEPFQFTVAAALKFVPLTVSVNAGLPMRAPEGEIAVTVGVGIVAVKLNVVEPGIVELS